MGKDITGKSIRVGDKVVCNQRQSSRLEIATVESVPKHDDFKMVDVKPDNSEGFTGRKHRIKIENCVVVKKSSNFDEDTSLYELLTIKEKLDLLIADCLSDLFDRNGDIEKILDQIETPDVYKQYIRYWLFKGDVIIGGQND